MRSTMRMRCANVFKEIHEIDACYNVQSFELTFNMSNLLLHIQNGSCKNKYFHVYKNKKIVFTQAPYNVAGKKTIL